MEFVDRRVDFVDRSSIIVDRIVNFVDRSMESLIEERISSIDQCQAPLAAVSEEEAARNPAGAGYKPS
ncbi:hypothetical protein ACQCVP_18035 [Rossellomorea vietnamensis]